MLAVVLGIFATERGAAAQDVRYHHGLYVRVAGGASYFSDAVDSDPLPLIGSVDGTLKGGAVSGEFAVGGSIKPGFVVGGAVFVSHMPAPSATNAESKGTLGTMAIPPIDFDASTLTVIGPFVDYYFDPSGGLHAQASAGYGILSLGQGFERGSGNRAVQDQTGHGFAFVLGGGYEWWVSSSWGVGVLGQLMIGLGSGDDSTGHTWRHHAFVPGLYASATMN